MKRNNLFNTGLSKNEVKEFELHVRHNMKKAYFSALGFVGSHDSAVELSQQAFIRAYRSYKSFDKNKKFFTWYYKILKNLCLNFIRDTKKNNYETFIENAELINNNYNPDFVLEQKELHDQVHEAILSLSESDREIIILKEFQNISYNAISELMKIPIGTVMSKLFYARKRLAKSLKGVL